MDTDEQVSGGYDKRGQIVMSRIYGFFDVRRLLQNNRLKIMIKVTLFVLAAVFSGVVSLVANTLTFGGSLYDIPVWVRLLAEFLASLPGFLTLVSLEVLLYYFVKYYIINGTTPGVGSYMNILRTNKFKIPILIILVFMSSFPVYFFLLFYLAAAYG